MSLWGTFALVVASASAAPGVALNWSAPVGCPSQEQVEAAVGRMVQDTGKDAPIDVRATVTGRAAQWHVELLAGEGRRELNGASCRAVSEAAVVLIALMVDPLASTDAKPTFEEPKRAQVSVGVWGLVDTHTLPKPSPGAGVIAALGVGSGFFLELQGLALLRQLTTDEERPGASVFLAAGALGARRDFDAGPFSFAPVVALEAGALRGVGFGVTNPASQLAPWFAPRAGVMFALTVGVFRTSLRAEAVIPVTRPRFGIDGVGLLHTPAFISFRGSLSVELSFPPRVEAGPGH